MKRFLLGLLCILLVSGSVLPVTATSGSETDATGDTEQEGRIAGKDEVVYATLHPNGEGKELYVVNSLEVVEAGRIVDYGEYKNLKNLTDLSELEQSEEEVNITAPEGKFYYQGDLLHTELPWELSIKYFLDGEELSPEELAGRNGDFEIVIETSQNEAVDPIFFENYLLQVSFSFDGEKTRNVETEEGTLANAGKDTQVTFTVMPGEEAVLSAKAEVEAFELSGIDIAAVPQNMSIDAPDTDEFTEDIVTLADALREIDNGVVELKNGTRELHDGASALRDGSTEYRDGISALDNGSSELESGSNAIREALETMRRSLSDAGDMELGDIDKVTDGLSELADGLREIEGGLSMLNQNYGALVESLDEMMNNIPHHEISEAELGLLMQNEETRGTAEKLVEVYEAALTAKGTYEQMKQPLRYVTSTLDTVTASLGTIIDSVEEMKQGFSGFVNNMDTSSGLTELQKGLSALSANYKEFHKGLLAYTAGVGDLAAGYSELDTGIAGIRNGSGELADGVTDLREGTSELADATSDMPEQVTEEIDELLSQYDRSDFEAVSFVSEKNEAVNTVQFVLKTEPIEMEEQEEEVEEEEEKSLWQRFLDLFTK